MAGGGSVGVLLGGLLTDALSWHWVFLVNIPIGVGVYALTVVLLRESRALAAARLDVGGALTVTASLMLAVYAVVNGNEAGWTSTQTLALLGAAAVLLALFPRNRSTGPRPADAPAPVPAAKRRDGERRRHSLVCGDVRVVLRLGALPPARAGLQRDAGRPCFSSGQPHHGGLFARNLGEDGHALRIRVPLAAGLALTAAGLALFALSPVDGSFALHVLPGMTLLGIGCGMAMNPVLLAAMSDVAPSESGLASGVVNTSFMMGGALGLAVLASLAAARTDKLVALGADSLAALNGGYHVAFALGAVFAAAAALLSALLLRAGRQAPANKGGREAVVTAPSS